jgi:hypothetical protein
MSGVLKTSKFLDDSYDKQVEFLHTAKKPVDLKPTMFFNALPSFHNVMLAELPGVPQEAANAMFSPTAMQCLYLHAMSVAWQEKCEEASKTMHNSTMLVEIQDYMQHQSKKGPCKASKKPRSKQQNDPVNQNYNQRSQQGLKNNRLQGRGQSNRTTQSCLSQEQLELTLGPLPGHADHTVSQCHQWQFQE